jgi:hypothetical protein
VLCFLFCLSMFCVLCLMLSVSLDCPFMILPLLFSLEVIYFVLLYFFFWPLCCLFFFDIRILIAPLVSSNSSYTDILKYLSVRKDMYVYNIRLIMWVTNIYYDYKQTHLSLYFVTLTTDDNPSLFIKGFILIRNTWINSSKIYLVAKNDKNLKK